MPKPLPPGAKLPRAHSVLISLEKITAAAGRGKIGSAAVLDLLQRAGIETEEVINWTRDPAGFRIYFFGAPPSERAVRNLA